MTDTLEVGWATSDITPDRPVMLQGQRHLRIAENALDPVTVTAWVLRDPTGAAETTGPVGRERNDHAKVMSEVVLVSCDLAFPSPRLLEEVRDKLASRIPDLPPASVILCATHTHTSLVIEDGLYHYPGGAVLSPDECRAVVCEKIVEAVCTAWAVRRPRSIRRSLGHAVIGHNRYGVYSDGHAEMYGKTDRQDFSFIGGYEDHTFDLYAVYEEDGRISGLAPVVPCPAQVDEHLTQLSADYWHDVREALRTRPPSQKVPLSQDQISLLPLCGAAGDQSPHLLLYKEQEAEMRRRRRVTERQEIAQRLLCGIERALTDDTDQEDTNAQNGRHLPLRHRSRTVRLTPRAITRADRDQAEELYNAAVASGEEGTWFPTRAKQVVDIFDGVVAPAPFPAEIHTIRIGDAVICTNPFELFLDYALQIKARSAAAQTSIVQLAGRGFYLPTQRAVEAGSYGAFPVVSGVGPRGGAELVCATLKEIELAFA